MLRFLAATIVAGAIVVGSSGTAEAFCRTTTVGIPANYNPIDRGCFTDGLLLFWRNQCISYSISEEASQVVPFADATRIIDEAFARWPASQCASGTAPGISVTNIGSSTCTEVRYNPNSANQNLIVFRDGTWPYSDAYSTLGLTTVTFAAETGDIFDADMEINSSQKNLSITDNVPANGFDLASVVTHEAGHFFGLAHATDKTATMYASYRPGTIQLRTLSKDDVAGICDIYPSTTVRTVSRSVDPQGEGVVAADACNASPRHGFTKICEEPTEEGTSCSAAPPPRTPLPFGSFAVAGVAGLALIVARRRRR